MSNDEDSDWANLSYDMSEEDTDIIKKKEEKISFNQEKNCKNKFYNFSL